jgi:PmbA protein
LPNLSENTLLEACRLAVNQAVSKGAAEVEAYAVSTLENEATIERNDITLGTSYRGSGLGVRIIKNQALGFSSVNRLSHERIDAAVDTALKIASLGSPDPFNVLPRRSSIPRISGILDPDAESFNSDEGLKKAVEMLKESRIYDERVTVDSGGFNSSLSSHAIVNSNGVAGSETISVFSWYVMGMAVDADDVSSFDFQFDGSHYAKDIDVVSTARRFAKNVVSSLGSKQTEAFKGTLVLSPEAAVDLIFSTLTGSINSNNVQKGRSRLAGRLGEAIASNDLTVVDDATWADGLAASAFDREGVPHRPITVIENGVLHTYLYNSYTAAREGVASTGHAAGDDESSPRVGVSNILVHPGPSEFEDLLREVSRGVLVTRFSGNVNPISGDFSGVVKGGQLIVNGQKIHPLKETLIAGNVFDLLQNISGVSKQRQKIFNFYLPFVRTEGVSVTSG